MAYENLTLEQRRQLNDLLSQTTMRSDGTIDGQPNAMLSDLVNPQPQPAPLSMNQRMTMQADNTEPGVSFGEDIPRNYIQNTRTGKVTNLDYAAGPAGPALDYTSGAVEYGGQKGYRMKGDPFTIVMPNGQIVRTGQDTAATRARQKEDLGLEKMRADIAHTEASTRQSGIKPSTTPAGYRTTATGNLEAIPGGPADTGQVDQSAANLIASRFIAGDKNALVGIARNKALHGAVMGSIARQATEQGVDAKELVQRGLEYTGAASEQRTMGNQAANVVMAASEARRMADISLDLSAKIPRTEFPLLNKVGNVLSKGTGDTNITAFEQSIDSLINGYARAINPRGVATVNDKKSAHERLQAAFTQGQFQSTVDVMKQEMDAAIAAPTEARKLSREARVGGTEEKTQSGAATNAISMAKEAIAAGKSKEAVKKMLQSMGVDPKGAGL